MNFHFFTPWLSLNMIDFSTFAKTDLLFLKNDINSYNMLDIHKNYFSLKKILTNTRYL